MSSEEVALTDNNIGAFIGFHAERRDKSPSGREMKYHHNDHDLPDEFNKQKSAAHSHTLFSRS